MSDSSEMRDLRLIRYAISRERDYFANLSLDRILRDFNAQDQDRGMTAPPHLKTKYCRCPEFAEPTSPEGRFGLD